MRSIRRPYDPGRSVPAVVLGGENGALPILRALARGGMKSVIVVSERPDDPTFHSRYCSMRVVADRFDRHGDGANLRTLISLAASRGARPVLLWGSDREVQFINRNREELSHWYRFVMADSDLTEDLVDKSRFAALAERHGLPVPETRIFPNPADILRQSRALSYPCTIKPARTSAWNTDEIRRTFGTYKHALRRLDGPGDLEAYLGMLPNAGGGLVVQKFIEGRDEELYSFHAYIDTDGTPMGCFVGRKIRTSPMHFGGSSYIETIHDHGFVDFCLEVCAQIGFTGIVKIDCKREASTGRYVILEFNPRFNLWEGLGAFAGVNLPMIWYDDLSGNGCRPNFTYRDGMRWLYAAGDLRALPAYVAAGEWTIPGWIRSFAARKVYHTFDWRDPAPLLWSLPRFLMRKAGRLRLRLSAGTAARGGAYGMPHPAAKLRT